MDCSERDRLAEALRGAAKELRWLHEEKYRLVEHEPASLNVFDQVMQDTQKRWYAALVAYQKHVKEHECAEGAAPSDADND